MALDDNGASRERAEAAEQRLEVHHGLERERLAAGLTTDFVRWMDTGVATD